MNNATARLKKYCDALLNDDSDWNLRRQSLEQVHALFVELGALNAQDGQHRDAAQPLAAGKAIAPAWAAMCLFDIARTRQFVLAIKAAIHDKLKEGVEPVQLLDAGCGPYALLGLLAALYFTPQQLQLTVLDIYEENINSSRTLMNALQMENYFRQITCADALQYHWPLQQPPHIAVTETMNRALSKEPQVAISLALSKMLDEKSILIPALIEVKLVNIEKTGEDAAAAMQRTLTELATVIALSKNPPAAQFHQKPVHRVVLPEWYNPQTQLLELHTHIRLYKNYMLGNNESAISLPVPLNTTQLKCAAGDELLFYYELEPEPGIVVKTRQD